MWLIRMVETVEMNGHQKWLENKHDFVYRYNKLFMLDTFIAILLLTSTAHGMFLAFSGWPV